MEFLSKALITLLKLFQVPCVFFLAILARRHRAPPLGDLPPKAAQRRAAGGAEHAARGRRVPAQGRLRDVEELLALQEAQAPDLESSAETHFTLC